MRRLFELLVGDDGREEEQLTTKESLEAFDIWARSLDVSGCPVGGADLLSVGLDSPEKFCAQQAKDGQADNLE